MKMKIFTTTLLFFYGALGPFTLSDAKTAYKMDFCNDSRYCKTPSLSGIDDASYALQSKLSDTTDATFKHDVLDSTIPVLVVFWAQWSTPSRRLMPTISSVAQDFASSATAMRLEVDDNPTTPNTYNVSSLPTVIIFKNGKEFRRVTGSPSKATLSMALQDALKKKWRRHVGK